MNLTTQIKSSLEKNEVVAIPQDVTDWLRRWKRLYINGEWGDGTSRETFPTLNPATNGEISEICLATREDVDRAVLAGRAAFELGEWSRRPIAERAEVLKKIGDLILEHRGELALLETLDTGKPIRESFEGDIPRSAANFHFFAELASDIGEKNYESNGFRHEAIREPLGVVALVTPWNLPLYLESWKIAPALLMGNSVVLKPSELTPLTATYLTELIHQVNLPRGVFQLLHGTGEKAAGEYLVSHSGVDAISFTGETSTGRAIMKNAAAGPTRVSFELGGKGASIIYADADLPQAVSETIRAGFRNQGEICLASPRVYVEAPIFEEFLECYLDGVKKIKVGDPLDTTTTMGALISKNHFDKVTSYLQKVEDPLLIRIGGKRVGTQGNFLAPTVVVGLGDAHPICQEEVFGPVVSIHSFSDEAAAVQSVNGTPYGLSASVWTADKKRAARTARALHVGLVWINSWFVRDLRVPFGGQKHSGLGREGGEFSLDFYSEWKSICQKMS